MNRSLLLVGVAALLVVIGGGVLATGASDDLFQDVDDVEIDDDAVALEPAASPEGDVYASLEGDSGNQELVVEIDNLNQLADTRVDNVFTATYNGDQNASIHFEDVGDDVTIFDMETGEPVEGEENTVFMPPEDNERTFGVDVTAAEDAEGVLLEDITVVAGAVEPEFDVIDVQLVLPSGEADLPPEEAELPTVAAGERVTVEVTVENRGSEFTRAVELTEATRGEPIDERELTLGENERRTIEFDYRTRGGDAEREELRFGADAVDNALAPEADGAAVLQVGEPEAEFDVSDIELSEDAVTAGSTVTATATAENVGGDEGTEEIELLVEGDAVNSTEITLDAEAESEVDLEYTALASQEGEDIEFEIQSATDETDTVELTVEERIAFEIEGDELDIEDDTLTAGVEGEDELVVEADIENIGGETGTARVWFEFDGDRESFLTEEIGDGETETVTFTRTVDDRDIGQDVPVTVFTEDDDVTEAVDVVEPAEFDVAVTDVTPTEISQGESIAVDVTVANAGGSEATQDITLSGEGVATDSVTETVDAGETEEITLTADTDTDVAPGQLELTVESDDDEQAVSAFVRQPATFEFARLAANDPVFADETLTLEVDVVNVGQDPGETTVTFLVEGEEIDTETTDNLDGGDIESLDFDFDLEAEGVDPGEIDVSIDTGDATASETVDVFEPLEEPFFRVESPEFAPTDAPQFDDQTITADATVRNAGEEGDEQTVSFLVDGEELDSETLELEGGQTQDVSFQVEATDLETGTRTLAIETDDSEREANIEVREPVPATFEAFITGLPDGPVEDGDTVEIEITNVGESDGTADVDLTYSTDAAREFSGTVGDTVEVPAGQTEVLRLTADIGDVARAGSFDGDLTLTVEGGEDTATDDVPVALEFGSISGAIDAANENEPALIGHTPDGPTETVRIDDDDITVLDVGGSTLEPDVSDTAFEVSATNVTLDGLTLSAGEADGATAIDVAAVEDAELVGLTIEGDGWNPAIEDSGDGTEIRYTDLQGVDAGVVGTGTDLVLRDSQIRNSGNATDLTEGASNATIRNTDLISNERGLFADSGTEHTVSRNNIERNDAAIETNGTDAQVSIDAPENWWGSAAGPVFADDIDIPEGTDREDVADILSNVEFVTVSSTPFEGAEFAVEQFDEREIAEDATLELELTVENDGGTSGSTDRQDIDLLIDGDVVDSGTVEELGAGESTDVELSHEPNEAGEFDAEIRSDDDSTEFDLDVLTAAEFDVSDIELSEDTVTVGETLSVAAEIDNVGGAAGSKEVVLEADGGEVDRASVDIAGGTTDGTELAFEPDESDVGTVTLGVVVPEDGSVDTQTVTVEEETDPTPTGSPTGSPTAPDEGPEEPVTAPDEAIEATESQTLVDVDPARDGIQVAFEETANLETLSFDNEEIPPTTTVEVAESETIPETASEPAGSVRAVIEIDVGTRAESEPATIEFALTTEEFEAEPTDIVMQRYDEGTGNWSELETSVVEATDDTVRFEAGTPGFSLFAVTELDSEPEPDTPEPDTDEGTPEPATPGTEEETPEPDTPGTEEETPIDEPADLPGFGVGVAVAALLVAALLAYRRR